MLVRACKSVEHGGLAAVGVARDGQTQRIDKSADAGAGLDRSTRADGGKSFRHAGRSCGVTFRVAENSIVYF